MAAEKAWWKGLAPVDGVVAVESDRELGPLVSADELGLADEELASLREQRWHIVRSGSTPPAGGAVAHLYRVDGHPLIGTPRVLVKVKETFRGKLGSRREDKSERKAREQLFRKYRVHDARRLHRGLALYEVRVEDGSDAFDVAGTMDGDSRLEYAEPVVIMPGLPRARPVNEPNYPRQWHLRNTARSSNHKVGADIDAERAWDVTLGAGSRIAIIDQGCDLQDAELAPAVTRESAYFLADGTLGGGNYPRSHHGTYCARVAVARWNRWLVSGVAPKASLLFVAAEELNTQVFCRALLYAADPNSANGGLATDAGADCIVVPLGLPIGSMAVEDVTTFISAVDPLLDTLARHSGYSRFRLGVPVFWSAGNAGVQDPILNMANVIGVGISDGSDLPGQHSTGPQLEFVAPGVGIECGTGLNGTSMSASIAAGVAALVVSVNPLLTRDEILRILRSTCEKLPSSGDPYVSERNRQSGWGRINAAAAVHLALVMRNRMGYGSPSV